jgi:hypothetical protein
MDKEIEGMDVAVGAVGSERAGLVHAVHGPG